MANFNLRYFKHALIIPVIGLATLVTSFISHLVNQRWGIALSAFALAAGLLTIIDLWLWWIWPVKYLYHLKDFRGEYTGLLEYEYSNVDGEEIKGVLNHKKVLTQTGSTVTIRSYTYNSDGSLSSESISNVESIELEKDGTFRLVYNYLNDGNIQQGFPPHYGTEVLKFSESKSEKQLSGYYYTNRMPFQSRGHINVKLLTKK